MTRIMIRKILAVAAIVALAGSPVFGSVCAMSCGTGGGSCCCSSSPGDPGDISAAYSNPSCCSPELQTSRGKELFIDRPATGTRFQQNLLALSSPLLFNAGKTEPAGHVVIASSVGKARSSPLFLLKASFLI